MRVGLLGKRGLPQRVVRAALAADREIPLIDFERCRNRLGWANYKGSHYTQAAECFEMVVSRLSRLDPKTDVTGLMRA